MPDMIWRPARAAHVGALAGGGFVMSMELLFLLAGLTSHPVQWAVAAICLLLLLGTTWSVWAAAFRPYLAIRGNALHVVNPLRSAKIDVDALVAVKSGYSGIVVEYREGGRFRTMSAWAVQKSNVAQWQSRDTRSDAVVRAIQVWLAGARMDAQRKRHE